MSHQALDHGFVSRVRYICIIQIKKSLSWIKTQELQLESDCECHDFYPLVDNLGNEKWIFSELRNLFCWII